MPAIVGIVKLTAISSSAVFNIGDVYNISPQAESKTFAGAGSFNTGDHLRNHNNYNITTTNDRDLSDQANAFNV
ncbi:spore germination protein PA [Scopulibacillus darangshiensis]|uniref:Spore germination protein PA n=1 Tax=Scopulibacillus darangshiensis TaxID=442528 RepID=A0A4R2PBT2_9BACL|nr:spore germination protein [Scopulibacillus darangshiensis]TCP31591.1 spore germination protein PA [Scopulibacillus darangshiensis]